MAQLAAVLGLVGSVVPLAMPCTVRTAVPEVPAVPPPGRDGQTQEAGDLPANALHPARRLLRSQQFQVFPETALVTPADRVHRRAHRRHDELLL
jgi:hypothetical protein